MPASFGLPSVTLVFFFFVQLNDHSNRRSKSPPPSSRAEAGPPSPSATSPGSRALSFRSIQTLEQHDDKASIALNEENIAQQVPYLLYCGAFINLLDSARASVGVRAYGQRRSPTAPLRPFLLTFTFFYGCCYYHIVVLTSLPFAQSAPCTAASLLVCTIRTRRSAWRCRGTPSPWLRACCQPACLHWS